MEECVRSTWMPLFQIELPGTLKKSRGITPKNKQQKGQKVRHQTAFLLWFLILYINFKWFVLWELKLLNVSQPSGGGVIIHNQSRDWIIKHVNVCVTETLTCLRTLTPSCIGLGKPAKDDWSFFTWNPTNFILVWSKNSSKSFDLK